jgi:hypothetical protein
VGASPCTNAPNPKSQGWYKGLCHNAHSGDSLRDEDAVCVGLSSSTFAGISHVSDICAVLEPSHPNNDTCGKAEDELMTLLLNICKSRVCTAAGIDSNCGGNTTVAQSLAESDAILSSPSRGAATCDHAQCLDKEINTGHALDVRTLLVSLDASVVRLTWQAPYLDDGAGHVNQYQVWRRRLGSTETFVRVGTTGGLTYVDATSGAGNWEYDLRAVVN